MTDVKWPWTRRADEQRIHADRAEENLAQVRRAWPHTHQVAGALHRESSLNGFSGMVREIFGDQDPPSNREHRQ